MTLLWWKLLLTIGACVCGYIVDTLTANKWLRGILYIAIVVGAFCIYTQIPRDHETNESKLISERCLRESKIYTEQYAVKFENYATNAVKTTIQGEDELVVWAAGEVYKNLLNQLYEREYLAYMHCMTEKHHPKAQSMLKKINKQMEDYIRENEQEVINMYAF